MSPIASSQDQDSPEQSYWSAVWLPFEKSLVAVLAQLEEHQFLVISVKCSSRFVQFADQGSFGMRAETSSNSYLPTPEQLDRKQLKAMAAIGWLPPTGSPGSASPEEQTHGSANFFQDSARPVNHERVAKLAVRTLAEVLRVPHPGFLDYRAFGDNGRLDFPTLGLKAQTTSQPTNDVDNIRQRLLAAISEATGIERLEYDSNGDIRVRLGTAIGFARVMVDPPFIRIYSPILNEIEADPALLARLNDINANSDFARYVHRDGTVFGVVDLMAIPFVAEHVIRAFGDFMAIADGFDDLLKTEFGGQTAYKNPLRSTRRH